MTTTTRMVAYLAVAGCLVGCLRQSAVTSTTRDLSQSRQAQAASAREPGPAASASLQFATAETRPLQADLDQSRQLARVKPEHPRSVNLPSNSHGSKAASSIGAEPTSSMCEKIINRLGHFGVDNCEKAQLVETGHRSVNGLPILQKVYSPKAGLKPLGRVTIIGGTHGDELSSIALVFKWLQKLDRHHSGLFHWTVVPLLNPDGALSARASRVNANGIDLNRNLPTSNWKEQSRVHWDQRMNRDPRYNPGAYPGSEPENQWLIEHIRLFKPDVIISVHSPYDLVDYDAPDRGAAPKRIGKLRRNFLGVYPGSLGNYAGMQNGIPVVTLELKYSHVLPSADEISFMWVDLVQWLTHQVPRLRLASTRPGPGEQEKTTPDAAGTVSPNAKLTKAASKDETTSQPGAVTQTSDPPRLPAAALMARGNALLGIGDLAGARLFFELVAKEGVAAGATGVGKTYDPLFYGAAGVEGAQPNPALARDWYEKASGAGDKEGRDRLAELNDWFKRASRY